MKLTVEKKNKIFAAIFIFIISIYGATMIHEIGHAIASFILGCNLPMPEVSPVIIGVTHCLSPENWFESLNTTENIISISAALLFVSLIGLILLLIYKYSKYIKKHYILAFILYFFAFNSLLNGFLQSMDGSDVRSLWELGINPIYTYLFAGIVGIFLIYLVADFKNLIKGVEPSIKKRNLKILSILFWILFILICSVYLALPYIF